MAENDLFEIENNELEDIFPTIDIAPNPYSEKYTSERAFYASLAVEPLDGDEAFEQIVARNRELIASGQENIIEEQARNQHKRREIEAAVGIQNDLLYTPNSSELITIFEQNRADIESREERAAIEKESIQKLQDMMVEDPYQAALYVNSIQQGDLLDRQRDRAVKLAIYQRELDKLRVEAESRGIAGHAVDFAMSVIDMPLSAVGEVLTLEQAAVGGKKFFRLPSGRVQEQAATLWNPNVSVDEFEELVVRAADIMRENSGVLGDNESVALESFANLRGLNNSDALTYNAFTALDVASIPGAGLAVKAVSSPVRVAKALGNRTAAVRSVANDVLKGNGDAASNAAAARESFPSSLVPDTPDWSDPSIGLHGDVVNKLADIQAIKNAALNIAVPERAAPEQYAKEVQKKVEELSERFKDENIIDIKRAKFGILSSHKEKIQKDIDEGFTIEGFHGTDTDISSFNRMFLGQNTEAKSAKEAFFFSSDREVAEGYSIVASAGRTGEVNQNIIPVRLRLKNPLIHDFKGKDFREQFFSKLIERAKKEGHDGVIFKNVDDDITAPEGQGKISDVYAVFSEDQIRNSLSRFSNEPPAIFDYTTGPRKTETSIDPVSRIRSVSMYLGRKTGDGGYLTAAAAKNGAVRRGFALEDVEIYHGVDDRHYIKVTENVAENGITAPVLKEADFPATGKVGSIIKNPDNFVAQTFSEQRHLAAGAKARLSAQVIRPLVKQVKNLGDREIKDMNKVMVVGEREQKWFSPEELTFQYERMRGSPPSEKEILAYYSAKELNDYDYMVRNNEVYTKRARLGYETVNIDDKQGFVTGRRNGLIVSSNEVRGKRIYDVEEHRGYAPNTNNDAFAAKLESGNYNLVRLESTYEFSGEPIKYVLVHKRSMTRGPLERQQLGYRAGGHRLYRDKFFVKQARRLTFKDGDEAWDNPLTHIVAKTEKQARQWAEGMERARLAYRLALRGEVDQAYAETVISESTELSFSKFDKLVKDGQIDLENPFEVLYDGTTPSAMSGVGTDRLWVDEFADGTDQWYNTSGKMYYSGKGEHLKNPFDEYAEILDPFESIQKSVVNALGTQAMSNYQTFAMEEWTRVAGPYMKKGQFAENPSRQRVFFDGQFDESFIKNKPELHAALEANRSTIRRFAGYQTAEMHGTEMASRRLAAWLDSEKPGVQKLIPEAARTWMAGKAIDMMDSNPINAVRGAVFTTQLSLYDPGQLFLQSQTALAAVSLSPVNGARAAAMIPFIRLVGTNLNPGVLDYVAKKAKIVHGLEPEEFKTMVKTMMDTGEYDIGGSIIELGNYNNKIGGNAAVRRVGTEIERSRFFFDEAERINRTVAWQLGWKDVRKRMPDEPMDSPEFIQAVKLRAADYGMNMRDASAASWQRGVFSIPTQFMSYQMRLLENMLPKVFGGNPRFSAAQKMRLALGQTLLYGTAGLPIINYAGDQWKKHRGEDLTPEAWRAVTKGFWDTFFYHISGGELDTDFAQRAGVGAGWEMLPRKLIDGSQASWLTVMGGPAGTVTGDVFESFNRVALYGRAGLDGDTLNAETFKLISNDLASHINSVDRATKAMMVWRLGKVVDRKTGQFIPASDLEGFAVLLGIPLREQGEYYEILSEVYSQEKEVKEIAKVLAVINDDFFAAMEKGDEVAMSNAQNLRAAIIQSYNNDPIKQQQITQQTLSLMKYDDDKMNYARQLYQERLGKTLPTEE